MKRRENATLTASCVSLLEFDGRDSDIMRQPSLTLSALPDVRQWASANNRKVLPPKSTASLSFASLPMTTMDKWYTATPSNNHRSKLSTDTKFWLFLMPFLCGSLAGWCYLFWWFSEQAPMLLTRLVKLFSYLA
jgi:hypothetical protein